MKNANERAGFLPQIVVSGRIVLVTMVVCCFCYTLLILGVGQTLVPYTANGSLIFNAQGELIGSAALAQSFSRPEYFWPRPSAVNYNAAATGASNLSPANPALRERARQIISHLGQAAGEKVPADLVTASGSGMDPNITLEAAKYQAQRVASARGLPVAALIKILNKYAKRPGGVFTPEPLVNVLFVNMTLDKLVK